MRYLRTLLLVILFFPHSLVPQTPGQKIREHFCPDDFDSLPLSSWTEPTVEDFQIIENYLRNRQRRIAGNLADQQYVISSFVDGWTAYRVGKTIITDGTEPKLVKIDFGNDPNQRERCIICYISCGHGGRNYENGLAVMIKALEKVNFKGHLIYRVCGWPSLSKGRLHYADVPYAFKPFMFEEVKDMGYRNILWLDSCFIPIKELSAIFSCLEKNGYCYYNEGTDTQDNLEPWDYIRQALNAPQQSEYLNVITQIVGISCTHPTGLALLEEWTRAACAKLPFLNHSADQLCFSYLINKNKLHTGRLPASIKCGNHSPVFELPEGAKNAFFYHNYRFIDSDELSGEQFLNCLPYHVNP